MSSATCKLQRTWGISDQLFLQQCFLRCKTWLLDLRFEPPSPPPPKNRGGLHKPPSPKTLHSLPTPSNGGAESRVSSFILHHLQAMARRLLLLVKEAQCHTTDGLGLAHRKKSPNAVLTRTPSVKCSAWIFFPLSIVYYWKLQVAKDLPNYLGDT